LPPGVQPAILAAAQESEGNKFISYGYRRLENYQSVRADGKINGDIERPFDLILQVDPIMLTSQNIAPGMSGAPVLDQERNRVIGIIAETWDSAGQLKDRDTAFAVDCKVLSFKPINLLLEEGLNHQSDDMEPSISQGFQPEVQGAPEVEENSMAKLRPLLDDAPLPLSSEWVGREDLLQSLNKNWLTPEYYVMGLIGFGGEGKTSLARQWLSNLLNHPSLPQPDGIFWWNFNEKPYVDEFFRKIFEYLDIGQINPDLLASVDDKVKIICAMKGRYLFILDGIEVLQHQMGDDYGLLTSKELRSFLRSFAEGNHQSFCLVTSRAPLIDLLDYPTYTECEVKPLSTQEGRTLLKKLGIKGSDRALGKVVNAWGGYALMLTLIAAYLKRRGGQVRYIREIPPPEVNEPLHERVQRVLHRYDENLTDAEREFLTVLGAFRLSIPLKNVTFKKAIFRGETGFPNLPPRSKSDGIDRFITKLQRLLDPILHPGQTHRFKKIKL
jgi:NACHT domain